MLTDAIAVTCRRSRHSGYCKWFVNAYCPDTIGMIASGKIRSLRFNPSRQSVYAWHSSRPAGIRVTGSTMSACHPRPFPSSGCATIGGFTAMVFKFVCVLNVLSCGADLTFAGRYINSMPMIFAFRVVDCFFCMGPKVLFQVG
jgi:hypothetical protein